MDQPVTSAHDLAAQAAQATASLYKVCEKWSDAPRSVHELLDDLDRASVFLYATACLISTFSLIGLE